MLAIWISLFFCQEIAKNSTKKTLNLITEFQKNLSNILTLLLFLQKILYNGIAVHSDTKGVCVCVCVCLL